MSWGASWRNAMAEVSKAAQAAQQNLPSMAEVTERMQLAKEQALQAAEKAKQTMNETLEAVDLDKLRSQMEEKRVSVAGSVAAAAVAATAASSSSSSSSSSSATPQDPTARLKNFTYIMPRIVNMGFPAPKPGKNVDDVLAVSEALKAKHAGHFMVWNLSEKSYDTSLFEDQVIEYRFPGHPAPPLGLLVKICTSIENWLIADEENVAVIHCATGRGRTACIIACYLAWMGEVWSPLEGLQYVCDRRRTSVEHVAIPSQRRYVQYFTGLLDGIKPRSKALILRRVIVNTIPNYDGRGGCRPYLQIFKHGKLIWASTWQKTAAPEGGSSSSSKSDAAAAASTTTTTKAKTVQQKIPRYHATDGSMKFVVDTPMHGDILVRCRHLNIETGARESMFRAGFHTGYVQESILRLTKSQLDGAALDKRVTREMFVEFIFGDVNAEGEGEDKDKEDGDDEGATEAGTDEALVIQAGEDTTAYDGMIASNSSFWSDVARRRRDQQEKREATKKRLAAERAERAAAAAALADAEGASEEAEAEAASLLAAARAGQGDKADDADAEAMTSADETLGVEGIDLDGLDGLDGIDGFDDKDLEVLLMTGVEAGVDAALAEGDGEAAGASAGSGADGAAGRSSSGLSADLSLGDFDEDELNELANAEIDDDDVDLSLDGLGFDDDDAVAMPGGDDGGDLLDDDDFAGLEGWLEENVGKDGDETVAA